jgi:primary-amine oxidase
MIAIEKLCLEHPLVLEEAGKLKLPKGVEICCEPWIYGTDDEAENRRLYQCYLYLRSIEHEQANHYSIPISFSPVFNAITKEFVRMDYLPNGADTVTCLTEPWKPVKAVEYAHDLLDEPLRTDLKPYIVQQPNGPSFTTNGQLVKWQKWRFRVGFNSREGVVLYNVTYDGRNVFYRLSLSEMTVPYGGE